jgi:hypothetical protein
MKIKIAAILITTLSGFCFMHTYSAEDIRKFGLEFLHNKRDENGNTFWHQLALKSDGFKDWSQVEAEKNSFKCVNKNWLPNPLIENNDNNTARKEAKIKFMRAGNPVSGLLVMHLRQQEEAFLNQMALEINREIMKVAQNMEHPNK